MVAETSTGLVASRRIDSQAAGKQSQEGAMPSTISKIL